MVRKKLYHTNRGWMIGSALISAAVLPAAINGTKANADTINQSSNVNSEEINKSNADTSSSVINSSVNDSSSQGKDIKSSNVNDNNGLNVSNNEKQDNKQNQNSNLGVTNNQTNNASSNNNFGGDVTSNNSAIKDNAASSKNINSNNQEAKINAKDNQVSYASESNNLSNNSNTNVNYKDKAVSFVATNNTPANAPITDTIPTSGPTLDNSHVANYHLNVSQGWSNDVQSITQDSDGTYNIYYLHSVDGATNVFGPSGQDWFHTTTKDWKTFSPQEVAINAKGTNSSDSWQSAWTGSIITNQGNIAGVPQGDKVAYFSGLSKKDGSQNIYAAWSDDNGNTFTHALNDGNPVLAWNQNGASGKQDQERDADVVYWNGKMLMYCAEGDQLGVYQSTDGVNWTKADPNGESKVKAYTFAKGLNYQDNDIPVECPQLRFMTTPNGQTKAVLFYGDKSMNTNPKQTTGTYYIVGHLDNNGMFAADTDAHRLDLGSDYYGSNVSGSDDLSKPDSSLIGLGWIGNWGYTANGVYDNQNAHKYPDDKDQLTQRLGSYSIPRKMVLNDNLTISSTPLNGLTNKGNTVTASADDPSTVAGKKDEVVGTDTYGPIYSVIDYANDDAYSVYDLHFKTKDNSNFNGRLHIDIWQGKDYVKFNYDPTNGYMAVAQYAEELDNDISGTQASSNYYDGTQGNGQGYLVQTGLSNTNDIDLKVFTDMDSVEVFFPNGQVYTVARYSPYNVQDFKVLCEDPDKKDTVSLTKQTINPVSFIATPNNNTSSQPVNDSNSSNTNSSSNSTTTNNSSSNDSSNSTGTNDNISKYVFSVEYYDNNTGEPTGDYQFTSDKPLSDSEIDNDVKSGTKLNVINYNLNMQPVEDGVQKVDVYAFTGDPIKVNNYNYTVAYFDNNTGEQVGTTTFSSNTKLSDDEVSSKVQAGTKEKVISYNTDEDSVDNGNENISIIATVDQQNEAQPKSYTYTVEYFDANTGEDAGTYTFSSNSPLSNDDIANKVQAGTKEKVTFYNVDEDNKSADGSSEVISIIATVNGQNNTSSSQPSGNTSSSQPSGNNNSSQPNGNTSSSQPNGNTGSSQPNGNTSSSQPSGNTGSSQPNGNTSSSQPNGNTGSSQPNGNTSSSQPSGNTSSSQPSGNTSSSKPSGNTSSSKTNGNTGSSQPSGNTSSSQPSGNTSSSQPSGNTSSSQPSGNTSSSQPSGNTGSSQPSGNTSSSQPNGNTGSSQPSGNTSSSQPSSNTGSSQPSSNNSSSQPNGNNSSSQPNGNNSSSQPNGNTSSSQPNGNTNSSQLSGNTGLNGNTSSSKQNNSQANELANSSTNSGSSDINSGEISTISNKDINNSMNNSSDDKSEANDGSQLPQTGDTKDELLLSLMLASGLIGMGMIRNKKED